MASEREPAARPMTPAGRSDRFAAVFIFFVSAVYVRYAFTFQPRFFRTEALGPTTFPLMIGILMLVCSTVLFIQSYRTAPPAGGPAQAAPRTGYVAALLLWLFLLGYSWGFDRLGFPLATALFLLLSLWLLGVRPWWKVVLYAIAFTAATWYVFGVLDVRLPKGEWLPR